MGQRSIDGISQKVLTDSLRQMMSDGLAYRHDYHEQPPRVEYPGFLCGLIAAVVVSLCSKAIIGN